MNSIFDLTNKTILITGGATHLGKSMADGFCQFGANLVIASRNKERNQQLANQLCQTYGTNCIGEYLDFLDNDSIHQLLKRMDSSFQSLDVLVNNAALSNPGNVHQQSMADFMQGITGTIGGTFQMTSSVLPIMMKQNYGSIINISSMYGLVSPDPRMYDNTPFSPNPANYGCGKAAVLQFTKYIACNYAKFGIRSNAIAPGPFPSLDVQEHHGFIDNLAKKTPLGRIGVPEDLVGTAVLLASNASSYLTGQCISVDGGWTAW